MRRLLDAAVRPAAALMARLRYAQKFALIAVVMLAPLAYVAWEYRGSQQRQIDFSAKERLGVDYVRPVSRLLIALGAARDAAVRAASAPGDADASAALAQRRATVRAALPAVAAVDARLGAELATTSAWSALRERIEAALAAPPRARPGPR